MRAKIKALLFEAYRRNEMFNEFERAKPIGDRWLGLGTEAAYRPMLEAGLMEWACAPPSRAGVMGWLKLTPAGVSLMKANRAGLKLALAQWKRDNGDSYLDQYMLAGGLVR